MSLRKASSYSKKKTRPFTRVSAIKAKAYIKTVPQSKINKLYMGDIKGFESGKHRFILRLIAEEKGLIRDNSLESCRMHINKLLEEKLPGQFYLALKVYPHHLIRENKTAAGAGADRMSSGMTHSYGIVIGRAAIVPAGKDILMVSCTNEKAAHIVKVALATIKAKVPCRTSILYERLGN